VLLNHFTEHSSDGKLDRATFLQCLGTGEPRGTGAAARPWSCLRRRRVSPAQPLPGAAALRAADSCLLARRSAVPLMPAEQALLAPAAAQYPAAVLRPALLGTPFTPQRTPHPHPPPAAFATSDQCLLEHLFIGMDADQQGCVDFKQFVWVAPAAAAACC
jgi:hypothetical protein